MELQPALEADTGEAMCLMSTPFNCTTRIRTALPVSRGNLAASGPAYSGADAGAVAGFVVGFWDCRAFVHLSKAAAPSVACCRDTTLTRNTTVARNLIMRIPPFQEIISVARWRSPTWDG